jgi:hypothetical protein
VFLDMRVDDERALLRTHQDDDRPPMIDPYSSLVAQRILLAMVRHAASMRLWTAN